MGRKQSSEGTTPTLRNCYVQLHRLEMMVDQYNLDENEPPILLLSCFVQLDRLEVDRHTKVKRVAPVCKICGKVFKRFWNLTQHTKNIHGAMSPHAHAHMMSHRHTGEKPYSYSCPRPHCEKTFSTAKNCQIHEIAVHRHHNSRRHKCEHCDKAFNFISQKMIHERRHREKAHRCKYCEKGFHRRINLVRHRRIHTHTGKKVKKLIRKQKSTILNKFGKRSTKHNNILARNRSRVLVRKPPCAS